MKGSRERPMADSRGSSVDVTCPCCHARLKVDAALGRVLAHEPAAKHAKVSDLDRAGEFLREEASRREAIFEQSAEHEKIKDQLLERKFEEALKKSKDEPV